MGNRMGKSKEYYFLLPPNLECDLVSLHCSAYGKYHILNTKYSYKCTRFAVVFLLHTPEIRKT